MAQTPEEEESLVLIKYEDVKTSDYMTNSGKTVAGFDAQGEVTIIDRTLGVVIFRKQFINRLENKEYANKGAYRVTATSPIDEIYSFLGGLPRK